MTQGIFAKSLPCLLIRSLTSHRTALVLILVAVSTMAVAADQKPALNPCKLSDAEAAGLNGDLSTDVMAVHEYAGTIAQMLKEEEFEKLDCVADQVRASKERFSGGPWKIHELYAGLYDPAQYPVEHSTQEEWLGLLQKLEQWKTTRPNSITAPVALARAYIRFAYVARGGGYANTVSEGGWKLFGERIAKAKQTLSEASTLPAKCPEWYLDMLLIAMNESWEREDAQALFEQADKFEPSYYYYARVYATYLFPQWSGRKGDTEQFTKEIADRVGGDQGDILYFQVASSDTVICGCDDGPQMSWERIERGFEASEKKYGVSMLNLNRIAYLATHYGKLDLYVADKTMTRIGEQWDSETWGKKEDFEAMKEWAAKSAPFVAKTRAIEAAAETNMKTPEGARYHSSVEKTYRGLVQACASTDGAGVDKWEGEFKAFVSVGVKGTVEDNRIYAMGPVAVCVYHKLLTMKEQQATPFPPPPQAPYWIRLDLDWADFAPIATK